MENFDKEINTEMVLREKRLQMSNQYAEVVVEYGAEHPYPAAYPPPGQLMPRGPDGWPGSRQCPQCHCTQ